MSHELSSSAAQLEWWGDVFSLPHHGKAKEPSVLEDAEPDPQTVWQEAMATADDPSKFVYDEDVESETESSDNNSANEQVVETVEEGDVPQPISFGSMLQYRHAAVATHVSVETPCSHATILRELQLILQGISTSNSFALNGVSKPCNESIHAKFRDFAMLLNQLGSIRKREALEEIRSLQYTTIVQFVLGVDTICDKYRAFLKEESVDASLVAGWLAGDCECWDLQSSELLESKYMMLIPQELRHEHLATAAMFAFLARSLYDAHVPRTSLQKMSTLQYKRLVHASYIHNAELLMNSGLKSLLLDVWKQLAAVYLAQDPRILLFIHDCHDWSTADTVLESIWPRSGITFSCASHPQIRVSLPPLVERVYGINCSKLFSAHKLQLYWESVVSAFNQDGVVELEMAELAKAVKRSILETTIPDPRSLLFA